MCFVENSSNKGAFQTYRIWPIELSENTKLLYIIRASETSNEQSYATPELAAFVCVHHKTSLVYQQTHMCIAE